MENEDKKVIKATRYEIESQLNNLVGSIKVNGLDKDCKLTLVKLKIKLGEIVEEISEFRKKTVECTIKPEQYNYLKQKVEDNKATDKEKAEFEAKKVQPLKNSIGFMVFTGIIGILLIRVFIVGKNKEQALFKCSGGACKL